MRVLKENNLVYFQLQTNRYCVNRLNEAPKNKCPRTKVVSNKVCLGMKESWEKILSSLSRVVLETTKRWQRNNWCPGSAKVHSV